MVLPSVGPQPEQGAPALSWELGKSQGRKHEGDAVAVCNLPTFIPCRAIPYTNLYNLLRKQSQKIAGLWFPQP